MPITVLLDDTPHPSALPFGDALIQELGQRTEAGQSTAIAEILAAASQRDTSIPVDFLMGFAMDAARAGHEETLRVWLDALPQDVLSSRAPVFLRLGSLCVAGGSLACLQMLAARIGDAWAPAAKESRLLINAAFHARADMIRWLLPQVNPLALDGNEGDDAQTALSIALGEMAHDVRDDNPYPEAVALLANAQTVNFQHPDERTAAERLAWCHGPHTLAVFDLIWPFVAADRHFHVLGECATEGNLSVFQALWARAKLTQPEIERISQNALRAHSFPQADWLAQRLSADRLPAFRDQAFLALLAWQEREHGIAAEETSPEEFLELKRSLLPWLTAWDERHALVDAMVANAGAPQKGCNDASLASNRRPKSL